MRVALVGGSGLVGRALTARLQTAGDSVVVLDRVRPGGTAAFVDVDLLARDARQHVQQAFISHEVDAVVHLAARVNPPKNAIERAAMRRLHDEGTKAVADAATAARVRRFVLVSSAVVYGAWPDNPLPLLTSARPRPCDLPYAVDKALQESVCRAAIADDTLTIVRPAIVYAKDAHNYLTEILRRARLPGLSVGVLPALDGCRPPLQFVHVDDVADVIAATLTAPTGTYHAASADWLAYDDVARAAGLRVVDVPSRWAGALVEALLPLMPPSLRAPRALFPYLMHPFVLDMAETSAALGVTPRWSSAQALGAMLGTRR
jgi:UDP-glucose 4-epimerase